MKFITKKHWLGWNSDDEAEQKWAHESGDHNFKEYEKQLEGLKPRLSRKNWEFFKNGLHDGQLISFNIGDGLALDLERNKPLTLRDFSKVTVTMNVMTCWFNEIYELKYEKVSKTAFDFPSEEPLFENRKIGDWGYDELSTVNESILKHEILFSSGTTILIEFEKFSYKKTKFEGSRY